MNKIKKIDKLVDFYAEWALDQEDEVEKERAYLMVIADLLDLLDEEILNQEYQDRIGGLND